MALYFYFNETTGDLVYSDKAAYDVDGYVSLGEQTDMNPLYIDSWVFESKRSSIKTVTKDPAINGKISGLKRMGYMFDSCSSLTSLDLSGFDTSQVTFMVNMFFYCSSLTSLDLSGFDTSQVTRMNSMFEGCSSLTSLDLSGFDTSQVTNMRGMFSICSALASLDLSGFDTSRVTNMADMFYDCSLDVVRCRPRQFLRSGFSIPSSSGAWYDFKGAEVTDFSSDAVTTLYADPSMAPDGSKLVNLQDLKAALEAMDGGLPLTEDTVIAENGGEPAWLYMANFGVGNPGFVGRIEKEGSRIQTALICGLLRFEEYMPSDTGNKRMAIDMGLANGSPVVLFRDDGLTAGLTYKDGMPVLTAMGEMEPVMAGDHPYGFATYATDEDFMDYITRLE